MATIKMTLLEIVQDILNDMDSDEVNSISDTVEATQIANICKSVFFDIITTTDLPEHVKLTKLSGLSNTAKPNYLDANSVSEIKEIRYNVSTDGGTDYRLIEYIPPDEFLSRSYKRNSSETNIQIVEDISTAVPLLIQNDKMPDYYTSFDDRYLCMDSYDNSVDTTLQTSKNMVLAIVPPSFTMIDSAVPTIDDTIFPYYLAEVKSRAMSLLKGGSDIKVEQFARKHRYFHKNNRWKTGEQRVINDYGRK